MELLKIIFAVHLNDTAFLPLADVKPEKTKGGSITVPLTSCLTGLESPVWQLTILVFICKTE
jgi:hypothetical protein